MTTAVLRSIRLFSFIFVGLASVALAVAWTERTTEGAQTPAPAAVSRVDPALFRGLEYRMVGPHRGGRVTAVAGHRAEPSTFYMGATGGGVWKTTDYGQIWEPVSDGFFQTGSIGSIEVAESDPNIVYVGTGSDGIRSNVIIGRGAYKSVDAGKTWTFIGLRDAGQLGSVQVHPKNPDIVYFAALGSPFGPGPERGVFRSKNGGTTWDKVLFVNDRTGAISIVMNPSNPNELYAAAWRGERKPWTIISGGPAAEGGIYKTSDGGDTWSKLTSGLPQKLIGKIDLDISRSNPKIVYALIEAPGPERGLYRTDDSGQTWRQTSAEFNLLRRPFYYTNVDVDPKNPETVYVSNEQFFKSTDGGKTFQTLRTPHGDNHGMWINPDNPDVFIQCNDGGANVTLNGGRTWSTQLNQPTAELYMVSVDTQFPYRLYAPQQDNSTVVVPSVPPVSWGLDQPTQVWFQGPGCETGQIHPRPDGQIIYGVCKGEFGRYSLASGQEKHYWVYPQNRYGHNPKDIKYRFQRQSPFEVSPHDPKVIYHGSQVVHRTQDEGVTWETISPDLTAFEPDKQVISGEPITRDITGEEVYSTLYAIEESRLEKGVIWTGSNDGPVYVTRDGGKTWNNVTPKDLPPNGRIQNIEDSPHRKGSAYVAAYRYLLNDFQPYIYRTDDYGATWVRLTDGKNGIPADTPTRVVREDPDRQGLLYAGTEFGLYLSFDNGAHWQPFQLNLPVTPVTDIRVHQKDLVVATMGRGFWIMDNVTPLHQIGASTLSTRGTLFQPRQAWRTRYQPMGGQPDEPEYPSIGAHIDYAFGGDQPSDIKLDILDAKGLVIRVFSSEAAGSSVAQSFLTTVALAEVVSSGTGAGNQGMRGPTVERVASRLSKAKGLHRFVWDMRHQGAWDSNPGRSGQGGPLVAPGTYQARLTSGDWTETKSFELEIDPRVTADGVTQADLEEQAAFTLKVRDAISESRQLAARVAEARDRARKAAQNTESLKRLDTVYDKIVTAGGPYPQPMLIDQFSNIYRMLNQADQKVGRDAFLRYEDLMKELTVLKTDVDRLASAPSPQ